MTRRGASGYPGTTATGPGVGFQLFGSKGWVRLDVTRAALEAFAVAAQGGTPYPMSLDEMVHGAAVTEAVVRSAASGVVEHVA